MVFCCIPRCPSSRAVDTSITFHAFPTNPEVAAEWVKNVNLFIPNGGTWFPQTGNVVCCKHFLPSDFKPESKFPCLKPGSVPTVFLKVRSPSPDTTATRRKVETKSPLIVKVIKPVLQCDDDDDDDMDDAPLSEMLKLPPHSSAIPRGKTLFLSHANKAGSLQSNLSTPTPSTPQLKSYSKIGNLLPRKNEQGMQTVTSNISTNSNKSAKDNNIIAHHRPEDKENEQVVKKAKISNAKPKKKHSEADLIEIGPSTFLKINPDVITVTKKSTPSGNTVLQFVMNPKLGLDASKIFQPVTKLANTTMHGSLDTQRKDPKVDNANKTTEKNSKEDLESTSLTEATNSCDIEDSNSVTISSLTNGAGEGCQQLAPVILSTNLPVSHAYSFSLQQKYNANIRQKNRQIQLLKMKLDKLMKKVDELETKCIVQERQLDFPNIKKLRVIKKNASKGEPHANFIFEQIRGYNANVPVRWSDSTMTQCSVWCRKAPYAYEYFKKADLFRLPCVGTVKRYIKKHPEITTQIKNRTLPIHRVDSGDSSSDFEFDDEDGEEDEEPNNEDSVSSTSNIPCETILHVSPGLTDENSQAVEMILPTSESIVDSAQTITNNIHIITQSEERISENNITIGAKVDDSSRNDIDSITEEIIVESASNDQVKNIYIHPNQDGSITTLNVNGQEIILQPGNIIQLNSEITGIEGMENQYFVIPAAEDHIAGEEHQLGNGQPVSFVIQDGENEEQIIYIAEHPSVVTDVADSLTTN